MNAFTSFLAENQIFLLTAHVLFMAIGLGGATVSDILFFKFLKDYRISEKEVEVLHVLKDVIMFAIVIIVISGVLLYLPEADRFNDSPAFLVKSIMGAVVVINGIALHVFIAPHLIHLNLRQGGKMSPAWHKLAFALGAISVTSWYGTFLLAMTKSVLPFDFIELFGIYLAVLSLALVGSQIVRILLMKRASS